MAGLGLPSAVVDRQVEGLVASNGRWLSKRQATMSGSMTVSSRGVRKPRGPGVWVLTAYLAEGIPFAMVIWVAGTMFKDLGRSDPEITVGTASIGIAWSLKPFWAAFLDMARTKKFWVILTELTVAVLLAIAALALRLPGYFHVVLS